MRKTVFAFVLGFSLLAAMVGINLRAAGGDEQGSVKIGDFKFKPHTLTVAAGATVTWINEDDVPHVVVDVDRKYKSRVLDTGDRFSHRFDSPGTYEYFCSMHPRMTGRVIVK